MKKVRTNIHLNLFKVTLYSEKDYFKMIINQVEIKSSSINYRHLEVKIGKKTALGLINGVKLMYLFETKILKI